MKSKIYKIKGHILKFKGVVSIHIKRLTFSYISGLGGEVVSWISNDGTNQILNFVFSSVGLAHLFKSKQQIMVGFLPVYVTSH